MKKLFPLAFLAATSMACAQSSVQITGILGLGVYSEWGAKLVAPYTSNAHAVVESQDSKVPSRLVFRGVEDMGGGVSALFLLDQGVDPTSGAWTLGGLMRESYVGLRSTSVGTLTLGRQFHPLFNVRDDYDPTADSSNVMATAGFRMNSSVMYRTPTWNGVFAKLAYGFGGVTNNTSASRAVGGHLGYEAGKISTKIGFNDLKDSLGQHSATNVLWGGSYDFGAVVGYAEYGVNNGAVTGGVFTQAKSTDTLLGAKVPFGSNTLAVTWIRKNDKMPANQDATQVQVLLTHYLSKRTAIYLIGTSINDKNGAPYSTAHAPVSVTAAQISLGAQPFTKELGIGVRHSF